MWSVIEKKELDSDITHRISLSTEEGLTRQTSSSGAKWKYEANYVKKKKEKLLLTVSK